MVNKSRFLCLAIETSCDDTCAAVVQNAKTILSNVIASQDAIHAEYGGVFPEIAAREHIQNLLPVLEKALKEAGVSLQEIDLFAATKGPGLINSLLTGLGTAKTLSLAMNKPLIGVNHIEAHLYPALLKNATFPAIGAILSGGHTLFVLIESIGVYKLIASTVDDAIGEAFDKVAHLLGYPYPGGKTIEKLAAKGDASTHSFRAGYVKKSPLFFSFSGLKTAVRYQIPPHKNLTEKMQCDIAASFQKAAFADIVQKLEKAQNLYQASSFVFGGGVVQNQFFQKMCKETFTTVPCYFPEAKLSTDNAAMIGLLGSLLWKQGKKDSLELKASSRLPFFLV